ncbi:MAG: GGDEF domain-containing protein [Piscinibacter sp.]|nr:GGDEF domain-containing protein [Piscinibacter sp.]
MREALSRLLLGDDVRQRLRVSQALLVLTVYVVFAMVQHAEVLLDMIDTRHSWALTTWNLAGGFGFYLCIRSGLNLRLKSGRSLAIPQSAWAMVGIAWSYAITGAARGAVILIMILVVVFTMFELTPQKARAAAGTAFAMLALTMAYKAWTDPLRYDPRVEAMHGLFSGIVLTASYVLAVRIGRLRARLVEQRTSLEQQSAKLTEALERIRTLATRDELTGLPNRRAAMEHMQRELAVRARPEPMMTVALIDIDHFKRINDTHGHAGGDTVLRRLSEEAQSVMRDGDILARWGGEEFLLVMPATGVGQALTALRRIRSTILALSFDEVAPGMKVTFSAGASECLGAHDLEAAIARADAAMYSAKRAGRDRITAFEEAVTP